MNKLYLLNESTHHQIECNTICQRLYYHLASLQRESGAIKATVKHIADGVGISESGAVLDAINARRSSYYYRTPRQVLCHYRK